MSKRRVPSHGRKARRAVEQVEANRPQSPAHRYAGISLSGGKADRSSVAVLEFYPEQKKIFLSKLIDKIKAEEFISADLKIHEILQQIQEAPRYVGFDSPLSLPKCLRCDLPCPGFETCQEDEIKFIRSLYDADVDKKKPKKMFTPYTQRCTEAYLASQAKGVLDIQPAMGANLAPMLARALFIKRRLKFPCIEVSVKMSVWNLGIELKINKSTLKTYRNSAGGEEARRLILQALIDKLGLFVYHQDFKILTENINAFDAFIVAYVCLLKDLKKTQAPPKDFPGGESWAEFCKLESK